MFIILYFVTTFSETNLLQVSWGTKGSDKADELPSVSSSKYKDAEAVVEDRTQDQADVDAAFRETVTRVITKMETKEVSEKPTMDDENKTFRSRLVVMWVLSNAALTLAIENINGLPTTPDQQKLGNKQNTYFKIMLYTTFALTAIRFIGVCG
jgi:chitin synthase